MVMLTMLTMLTMLMVCSYMTYGLIIAMLHKIKYMAAVNFTTTPKVDRVVNTSYSSFILPTPTSIMRQCTTNKMGSNVYRKNKV